jgi:hypothetical protein
MQNYGNLNNDNQQNDTLNNDYPYKEIPNDDA